MTLFINSSASNVSEDTGNSFVVGYYATYLINLLY
jgi:hypothetical protein